MTTKVTLVLSGGGVKGAFQAGFLSALINSNKYDIEIIYGVSIGALIAPLIINRKVDTLRKFFFNFNLDDIFTKWPWWIRMIFPKILITFFSLGLYKKNNIGDIIWQQLSLDEQKLAHEKCRIVSWNLSEKKEEWFGGNESSLEDFKNGLNASSNLWLLTPPLKYKDQYYIDGGACNLFPIEPLLNDNNANPNTMIFFIDNSSSVQDACSAIDFPKTALHLMHTLHDTAIDAFGELKLKLLKQKFKNLHVFRPDEDIFTHNMDFDKIKILKFFNAGQEKYQKFEKLQTV